VLLGSRIGPGVDPLDHLQQAIEKMQRKMGFYGRFGLTIFGRTRLSNSNSIQSFLLGPLPKESRQ